MEDKDRFAWVEEYLSALHSVDRVAFEAAVYAVCDSLYYAEWRIKTDTGKAPRKHLVALREIRDYLEARRQKLDDALDDAAPAQEAPDA